MAEKKYISVNSEGGRTNDEVNFANPGNRFVGELVSVNPGDKNEQLDVRDLFLAHVKVNGKYIQAYTDKARRVVDISKHVELNPVTVDGSNPSFSTWECLPSRTPPGEESADNPHPNKRIILRLRDDGKWVAAVVVQEANEEQDIDEQTIDITSGKGGTSSLEIKWGNSEIDYGSLISIQAKRYCTNLLGYRLGPDEGLNEGKLLQPYVGEATEEPFFTEWKQGNHSDGLCAGDGAQAYVYDYEQAKKVKVEGGVAFGTNAKVTQQNAVQIGEGTNNNQSTFQFREWQLIDSQGHIPNERIVTDKTLQTENAPADAKAVGDALLTLKFLVEIEWAELKNLRDGNGLIPGKQYRITDYVATTNGNLDSQSANHPFDIIVTADDNHTLSEIARAAVSNGDTYFSGCNLETWQVWYCLDNDTQRFSWADSDNGKGVVYRLIDELGNDVPYDFKGLKFKAYGENSQMLRYTFDSGEGDSNTTDLSLDETNSVYGNTIKPFFGESGAKKLNRIVFKGTECHSNLFGDNCGNNTFSHDCKNNICVMECQEMVFGHTFANNMLGISCKNLSGGNLITCCNFGNNVSNVSFGNAQTGLESGFQFIDVGDGVEALKLKCTAARENPSTQLVKYVEIGEGISNQTIEINAFNQTHQTKYQLNGQETISI